MKRQELQFLRLIMPSNLCVILYRCNMAVELLDALFCGYPIGPAKAHVFAIHGQFKR